MKTKPSINRYRYFYILLVLVLLSCSSTKPNTHNISLYPSVYNRLATKNLLLANELGKLPEIHDGISAYDAYVLDQIANIYDSYPKDFDEAFNQMFQVGIPEKRKYCSPLQALFWLIEDGHISDAIDVVNDYSLDKLLLRSWHPDNIKSALSNDDVLLIIDNLKDEQTKIHYKNAIQNGVDKATINSIFNDYKDNPWMFSMLARGIISNGLKHGRDKRWDNLYKVTDRLNAPELVDRYINDNITYYYVPGRTKRPNVVFAKKRGDCDDLAYFSNYVLRRAGYKTFARRISRIPVDHIGSGVILNDSYLIVTNFTIYGNTMLGPYDDLTQVDSALSGFINATGNSDAFWF